MTFILDNISSTLVYGILALLLAGMQLRMQRAAIEQSVVYMSKTQTLSFADLLEQDIKQIGSGVEGDMIESITTSEAGLTTGFTFNSTLDDGSPLVIGYALETADQIPTDDGYVTLYRLMRTENGAQAGGSPATLRSFQIELLDEAGGAASEATARLVRVAFVNAYAIGDLDDYNLRQTYWGATLRPINLQD